MYAKVFERIVESSLMEEPIHVRYTFVFLLAIADPKGYVIGTDTAIARRLNMPLADFQSAVEVLKRPDPNSNSKEYEGRRVVDSDIERGYFMVNYMTYRDLRDTEMRRDYMRNYMARRRSVNAVNTGKLPLAQEEEEEVYISLKFEEFWGSYPRKVGKQDALKAFIKGKCHLEMESIIDGLQYIDASEPKYIPYPATWLNGRRWEDESSDETGHRSAV